MLEAQPIIPLRGRYSSNEMKNIFPENKDDYRHQCSLEMRGIFSNESKYLGWRKNWRILAVCQNVIDPRVVSGKQVKKIKSQETNIDYEVAKKYEIKLKHDVVAYLREYVDKVGKGLHEGATSCLVTDNQELTAMKLGLGLLIGKAEDFCGEENYGVEELKYRSSTLKARSAKGTTGTQASYLKIFNGDHEKVKRLDEMVTEEMGFPESYTITGQTYPRIVDYQVLSSLAIFAHSLYSSTTDNNLKKILKPYVEDIYNKANQAADMASQQWLERSLDDSSERRIIVSEAFYQADYILEVLKKNNSHARLSFGSSVDEKDKDALELVVEKLVNSIDKIHRFAKKYRDTVCTAYTHGQFAQPTTYGKRLDLWAYNFVLALKDTERLFEIKDAPYDVLNHMINSRLNQVSIAAGKMASDIRLLQHDLEVNEPFAKSQVGSSAMAYKKNPMKCERINGLSRNKIGSYNLNRGLTAYDYLNTDAILELVLTVFVEDSKNQNGFTIHEKKARNNLTDFMPFIASEDILIEADKKGGNRVELHEKVRLASLEARENIDNGKENNVLELMKEAGFDIDLSKKEEYLNPDTHVGRSREQVDEFEQKEVNPILKKYKHLLGREGDVKI